MKSRFSGLADVNAMVTGGRGNDPMMGRKKETAVGGILVGLMAVLVVFF